MKPERNITLNRLVLLSKADIAIDSADAVSILEKACSRSRKLAVAGICEREDNIFISLEPSDRLFSYVFSQFEPKSDEDLAAEIRARYFSGFSVLGDFDYNGKKWLLLSKEAQTS